MCAALVVCLLALPSLSASQKVEPELAPDADVAKTIDALGDNSLAVLAATKVKGEFNDLARLLWTSEGREVRLIYSGGIERRILPIQ